MSEVITVQDLETLKKHEIFEAEVLTGKVGGLATGADIDYATNPVTGQVQKTLPAVLRDAGFQPAAFDFTSGGTLGVDDRNKVVFDPVSQTWYSWSGALPHVITAGTNPIGDANWVPQTDPSLRGELAATGGAGLIGSANYAQIRAYDGISEKIDCLGRENVFDRAHGLFDLDSSDTTSADNDGTILVDALGRRWKRRITDSVITEWFGAKGDGVADDTQPIQKTFDYSRLVKRRVDFSPGTYRTTQQLLLTLGGHYSQHGMILKGSGKASSKILLDYSTVASPISVLKVTNASAAFNLDISNLEVSATTPDAVTANIDLPINGVSGVNLKNLSLNSAIHSVYMRGDAWLNSFVDLNMSPRDYGIRMDQSGTTNWFDECFVYGSNVTAYKITGDYSSIGSLAADNCIGTVYDLRYFSGHIGSLGAESPVLGRTPTTLIDGDFANVSIDYVRGFRIVPTNGNPFTGIRVGSGSIRIDSLIVDQHDQADANLTVNGYLVRGYRGNISIGKVAIPKDNNGVNAGVLTFSLADPQNTNIQLDASDGTAITMVGDGKPYMGFGKSELSWLTGITSELSKRAAQNIYLDAAGGPNGSGIGANFNGTRDKFYPGATQGSWFMEVDPGSRGCAGYAATATGSDMNSTPVKRIPIVESVSALANLPLTELWEGRSVWVQTIHKHVTYSTVGTVGWYDETGSKVA